jgi:hypothetical protein
MEAKETSKQSESAIGKDMNEPWDRFRAHRAPGFAKVPREILGVVQLGSCVA